MVVPQGGLYGMGKWPSVIFMGEAPGKEEDKEGFPFVGKSGKLLQRAIRILLGDRQISIYLDNVVRCRPPNNRKPHQDEIRACSRYFNLPPNCHRIMALGGTAASYLVGGPVTVTNDRYKTFWVEIVDTPLPVFVTFHPSAVLRTPYLIYPFVEDIERFLDFQPKPGGFDERPR
jgi:DNA polymerase